MSGRTIGDGSSINLGSIVAGASNANSNAGASNATTRKGSQQHMTRKKQYPLRVDPALWSAVQQWADDELRSVNGQMEFIIRDALRRAGRLPQHTDPGHTNARAAAREPVRELASGSVASGDVANDTARNSANDAGNVATDSHTADRNESGSSH